MTAYYNEIDPFAAAWLRELIKAGHIAPGEVDERSIEDVVPSDLLGYTQCHFFAGIGVWSYALRQAGWPDDRPVWTGSCPCQPFSQTGTGGGFADQRHLWPAFHHLIRILRPADVVGEQVASKGGLAWLDIVQTDLEGENYAFGAIDSCAASFDAPHIRQRLHWGAHDESVLWMGDSLSERLEGFSGNGDSTARRPKQIRPTAAPGKPCGLGIQGQTNSFWRNADWLFCRDGKWRAVEPGTFPLAHGATSRVGRLRGYGNAIVAPQAEAFIRTYMGVIMLENDKFMQQNPNTGREQ